MWCHMNFDRLRYIAERTGTGEKEAILGDSIPERTGAFWIFAAHQRSQHHRI